MMKDEESAMSDLDRDTQTMAALAAVSSRSIGSHSFVDAMMQTE
jgi:hypothetical protein